MNKGLNNRKERTPGKNASREGKRSLKNFNLREREKNSNAKIRKSINLWVSQSLPKKEIFSITGKRKNARIVSIWKKS